MKKLYRSRNDRMIAGVCGGIADYFDIDSSLVRIGLVLLVVCGGTGILAYIIAGLIVPEEPERYDAYKRRRAEETGYGTERDADVQDTAYESTNEKGQDMNDENGRSGDL